MRARVSGQCPSPPWGKPCRELGKAKVRSLLQDRFWMCAKYSPSPGCAQVISAAGGVCAAGGAGWGRGPCKFSEGHLQSRGGEGRGRGAGQLGRPLGAPGRRGEKRQGQHLPKGLAAGHAGRELETFPDPRGWHQPPHAQLLLLLFASSKQRSRSFPARFACSEGFCFLSGVVFGSFLSLLCCFGFKCSLASSRGWGNSFCGGQLGLILRT